MIPFGKILQFRYYDAATLERMKNDLALAAPLSFWTYCKKYYVDCARRDPYVEELKLLDGLFLSLQSEPGLITVHELYTNDDAVAEAYADMMQKHKELSEATAPITLRSLLNLANAYLLRGGKNLPHTLPTVFTEENGAPPRLLMINPSPKKETDLFALLLPATDPSVPAPDWEGLLSDRAFTAQIKSLHALSRTGILPALLWESDAFRINLDALCTAEKPSFAALLTQALRELYLVRIPSEAMHTVLDTANKHGFFVRIIAQAGIGGDMTAIYQRTPLFTLNTAFLKTLYSIRQITAKLQNEKDGELLSAESASEACATPVLDDFCGNQISISPKSAVFTNTFYASLLAVIRQCLCGSDYAEQRIHVEISLPKKLDEKASGAILSAVTAIYRLQAELGLLSESPRITVEKDLALPSISVIVCGDGAPLPTAAQEPGNSLSLLTVRAAENGLPDFDALRALLTTLKNLRREGRLLSARAELSKDTAAPISIFMESLAPIEIAY